MYVFIINRFRCALCLCLLFTGSSGDSLWEMWGKLVNDWESVSRRKAAYIKVQHCSYSPPPRLHTHTHSYFIHFVIKLFLILCKIYTACATETVLIE